MASLVLLSTAILSVNSQLAPPDLIDLVTQTLFASNNDSCRMYQYNYGGAIIFDSLYRATDLFSPKNADKNYNTTKVLDYNDKLSPILDYYLYNDTGTPAYKISHGQTIPWSSDGAIGDSIGLFPITYIDQLLYQYIKNGDKSIFDFKGKYATQWEVIFTSADYYILQFPRHLPNKYHVVSRDSGGKQWSNQTNVNSSFVWADDCFMGLTLLTRLAQVLDYCDKEMNGCNGVDVKGNISTYIDFVYNQHLGFAENLIYPNSKYNGLYSHGYNYASNDHSCCPWGRANAWIFSSRMEAIKMYEFLNDTAYEDQYTQIVKLFQDHANELGDLQDSKTGQWHQVINQTETFLEASASTGFFRGITDAQLRGLLPTNVYTKEQWDDKINLGWKGLQGFINETTGIIYGGCCGTGPQDNWEEYNERSTAYCSIGNPGDAAFVLNGIVSYQEYLNMNNK